MTEQLCTDCKTFPANPDDPAGQCDACHWEDLDAEALGGWLGNDAEAEPDRDVAPDLADADRAFDDYTGTEA